MKTIIAVLVSIVVGTAPLPTTVEPPLSSEPTAPKITVDKIEPPNFTPLAEISKLADEAATKAVQSAPSQSGNNETIAWNFLISQGFTRNQTAGIMGNLQQEHGFQTSDVPGGLGIAQWMGNRRDNLMARANYSDINVQLQFLADELGGIKGEIQAVDSVEHATITFQNKFERCGVCMESQRIQYAYAILGRH